MAGPQPRGRRVLLSSFALALVSARITAGCNSESAQTEADTDDSASGADLNSRVESLWEAQCTETCHEPGGIGVGTPEADLDLTVAASAERGAFSRQVPAMRLIEPGDPQASYLWHKVMNTHASVGGSGLPMPFGGEALTEEDLGLVSEWIIGLDALGEDDET